MDSMGNVCDDNGDKEDGTYVMDGCSETDDDYECIKRPAFFVDGEPNFDSGPPEIGLEYLGVSSGRLHRYLIRNLAGGIAYYTGEGEKGQMHMKRARPSPWPPPRPPPLLSQCREKKIQIEQETEQLLLAAAASVDMKIEWCVM
ncbi:hypothetical protein Dimus_024049 [Dionaea muscipula]